MKKEELIDKILYLLAIFGFGGYLITHESYFMFCGGLFLIAASLLMIYINKKNK